MNWLHRHPWMWCITRYPVAYSGAILCLVLGLFPALSLAILVGYAIKQLQAQPQLLTWQELVGEQAAKWILPLIRNTDLSSGIPVTVQQAYFPLLLAAVGFSGAFFRGTMEYILEDVGERVSRDLRKKVASQFLGMNFRNASTIREGLLASMMSDDTREIKLAFTRLGGIVISDLLMSIVFLSWLMLLDLQLFLLFLAVLFPAAVVIRMTGKRLRTLSRQGIEWHTEVLNSLLEKLKGWQTIHVHQSADFELQSFDRINNTLFNTWRRSTRAKALGSPLVEWLATIAAAFVVVVALKRIAEGAISSSVLASFLVTIGLLANSLQNMTTLLNGSKKGSESLLRIFEFLRHAEEREREPTRAEVTPPASLDRIRSVELKNITVNHSESGAKLLTNLNITLSSGNLMAIVGPSGVGKSTLLRVLLGLEPPGEGAVLVNGEPISERLLKSMAGQIAFVPQDPFLFDGSVLENVTYPKDPEGLSENQREQALDALKRAELQKLPTENVLCLSGGEKQRLMFARAFFRNASLIILDEGTSALDLPTERALLETMQNGAASQIVVVVAHRPMVKEFASHVLDLSNPTG